MRKKNKSAKKKHNSLIRPVDLMIFLLGLISFALMLIVVMQYINYEKERSYLFNTASYTENDRDREHTLLDKSVNYDPEFLIDDDASDKNVPLVHVSNVPVVSQPDDYEELNQDILEEKKATRIAAVKNNPLPGVSDDLSDNKPALDESNKKAVVKDTIKNDVLKQIENENLRNALRKIKPISYKKKLETDKKSVGNKKGTTEKKKSINKTVKISNNKIEQKKKTKSKNSSIVKKTITVKNGMIKYKVENGDCLWKIAAKFNTKTLKIIKVNKFENPNLIYVGQTINIPMS